MDVTRVAVVLGEVLNEEQKELFLKDIVQGFATCSTELLNIIQSHVHELSSSSTEKSPECIFYAEKDDLTFTVLCRPNAATVVSTLKTLFSLPKKPDVTVNIVLVYAGLLSEGSGHWLLPNYVFTPMLLTDQLHYLMSLYPKSADTENQPGCKPFRLQIALGGMISGGEWRQLVTPSFYTIGGHHVQISVNRHSLTSKSKVTGDAPESTSSLFELETFLSTVLTKLPEPYCPLLAAPMSVRASGDPTLRVSRPCLYLFPEGSGQASILALPGYSMLVNGGCSHRPSFWSVANYLDRIDSVLITHWGIDNILGFNSVLPLAFTPTNNQSILCLLTPPPNISTKTSNSSTANSPFLVSLPIQMTNLVGHLKQVGINPVLFPLTRGAKQSAAPKPVQLFQKVGQGCLELLPLTPSDEDVAEVRKVTEDWAKAAPSLMTASVPLGKAPPANKHSIPLLSHTSVSVLVIWRPAKDSEPILRFLFVAPNAHQARILTSLDAVTTGCVYLRHAKAVPTEYERKRSVAPTAATIRRPTTTVGAKTHSPTLSNSGSVNSFIPKTMTGRPSGIQAIKKETTGPSHRPTSKPTTHKETGNKLAPNNVNKLPQVKPAVHSPTVSQPSEDKVNSAKDVIEAHDVVHQDSTPVDNNSESSVISKSLNGNIEKSNGYATHDIAELDATTDECEPDQLNHDFNQMKIKNVHDDDNVTFDDHDHILDEPIKSNHPFETDPIDAWGPPQNLPLPTGPANTTKSSHNPTDSKKPAAHAPSRRLTSAPNSAATSNTAKSSRVSLAPRSGIQPSAAPIVSFAPGYSIASAHASGPGATKQPPYDKVKPIYVDVAFLPGGGNSNLIDVEFFKRVRARYYVATEVTPSCSLLEAITIGKESWTGEDAQLPVSLVLAYETEDILIWLGSNAGRINNCNLNVVAFISRSSIQLLSNEVSMADGITAGVNSPGYRIDF